MRTKVPQKYKDPKVVNQQRAEDQPEHLVVQIYDRKGKENFYAKSKYAELKGGPITNGTSTCLASQKEEVLYKQFWV